MTPKQLKDSILQQAIMGKLVPQNPAEGTGEELYQQIQREKEAQRQKKEKETGKKIKKEKLLPPVTADEIPFEIPESWKWVRLGSLCIKIGSGSTPKGGRNSGIYQDQGIPFLREQNIYDEGLTYKGIVYISSELAKSRPRSTVYAKDLLLNITGGSIGRCAIVPDYFQSGDINQHILIIRLANQELCQYIHTFICSSAGQGIINRKAVGAKAGFSAEKCKNMFIPLPPLAEQRRIVAKLEELRPFVEAYARAYDKLTAYEANFPEQLKKSILQEAVMGKLVPQNPAEGTGEELYQQIQREKEEQRKKKEKETGKKIRKEKPLPPLTADEIPFEIPANWKWVHIGDIFQHNTGKALNQSDKEGTKLTYITTSNLYWNYFVLDNLKSMPFKDEEIEKCTVKKGDLLVCEGGEFGRAAIWNLDEPIRIQNHIHRLRPYLPVEIKYFYYIFDLYKHAGFIQGKGIGIKGLSSKALHKLPVPFPPLAEQQRIVAKIEELLPLVEKLEKPSGR